MLSVSSHRLHLFNAPLLYALFHQIIHMLKITISYSCTVLNPSFVFISQKGLADSSTGFPGQSYLRHPLHPARQNLLCLKQVSQYRAPSVHKALPTRAEAELLV